jgi:subtilase family serine protease
VAGFLNEFNGFGAGAFKFGLFTALGLATAALGQEHQHPGRRSVEFSRPGEARPHSWLRPAATTAASMPAGLWPSDITAAYGIGGTGAGVTIAVVDAYDSPSAEADLGTFSSTFGLPNCTTANGCFKKVNQTGEATLPLRNAGWEGEINLDIQWVHAVAPGAKILLVEARSSRGSDLLTAVLYARQHASVVSMSWGGGESFSETFSDSDFSYPGVTFLASSGDTGGIVEWPSVSPNVISVGGTQLGTNSSTGRVTLPAQETAWSGSGGGCSVFEASLAAQSGFVPSTCKRRAVPDVSMDGGNLSPVAVYISMQGGWYEVWGTSLSVQLCAGVIGLANSARATPLVSALTDLYAAAANDGYAYFFRDVTSGTAGKFTAATKWDFVTGLGTPLANHLVPYLISATK